MDGNTTHVRALAVGNGAEEPAYVVTLNGGDPNVHAFLKELAEESEQAEVAWFAEDEIAPHALFTLEGSFDPEAVLLALSMHGVKSALIDAGRLRVICPVEWEDRVQKVRRALGLSKPVQAVPGRATFVRRGCDYDFGAGRRR